MTLHERIIKSFESETSRQRYIQGLKQVLDGCERSGVPIREIVFKMAAFAENHMREIVTKETMKMVNDRLLRKHDKVDGRLLN